MLAGAVVGGIIGGAVGMQHQVMAVKEPDWNGSRNTFGAALSSLNLTLSVIIQTANIG